MVTCRHGNSACSAGSTPLHFGDSLRLTRASKQYMYDDSNTEYLDCISSTAHGESR